MTINSTWHRAVLEILEVGCDDISGGLCFQQDNATVHTAREPVYCSRPVFPRCITSCYLWHSQASQVFWLLFAQLLSGDTWKLSACNQPSCSGSWKGTSGPKLQPMINVSSEQLWLIFWLWLQEYIACQGENLIFKIYRISPTIRRTFFLQKSDLKSTCVLYAEGKYLFPNLWMSLHLLYDTFIVR